MVDTTTPNLGMTKPEIGGSDDTWGVKLNQNFDILDAKTVAQSIQWTVSMGDGNPASLAGPWSLSRYGNDGLLIDTPVVVNRQTGRTLLKGLDVTETSIFNGNVTYNGNTTFAGSITGGLVIAGGGITVTGAAVFNNGLTVAGAANFNSLTTTAVATFGSNINVAGITTTVTLNVSGNANLNGNVAFGGQVTTAITMTYRAAPVPPVSGSASVYFDVNGNPVVRRPDGSVAHLGVPPGTIAFTGGTTADVGWALLNGQAINRDTNPALFARYGTRYGAGNGTTTFNLPDARGCVFAHVDGGKGKLTAAGLGVAAVLGAEGGEQTHDMLLAELVGHVHTTTVAPHSHKTGATTQNVESGGGEAVNRVGPYPSSGTPGGTEGVTVGVTVNSAGGGNPFPIVQPTLVMNAQVKLG